MLIIEGVTSISDEQLTFFPNHPEENANTESPRKAGTASISVRLLDAFNVSNIPFLGCDFDRIYPDLEKSIPGEIVTFSFEDINTIIACETICSAICHQMNWDFLRQAVCRKTLEQPDWLRPESLANISKDDTEKLLASYKKVERIRADERAVIFFEDSGQILSEAQIRQNLLECPAFAQDPEGKKLQLLLQKLSNYPRLSGLTAFCRPAVDYHLVRCFLRRGLLSPKTKLSTEFVMSTEIQRRESTMGALRQLCGSLIQEISNYTGLSINSVNQIEWYVGRSICKEGEPDCYLKEPDSGWVREKYEKCPFSRTCCALNFNHELLHIEAPTYLGTSY